jgi:hypothetical protein
MEMRAPEKTQCHPERESKDPYKLYRSRKPEDSKQPRGPRRSQGSFDCVAASRGEAATPLRMTTYPAGVRGNAQCWSTRRSQLAKCFVDNQMSLPHTRPMWLSSLAGQRLFRNRL